VNPTSPRVAVVTGAGSGIGEGTARLLAQHGHAVAVLDRDASAAARVAQEIATIGSTSLAVTADVSSVDDVTDATDHISRTLGPIGILVNNAGFTRDNPLTEMEVGDWDDVIATHLRGSFLMLKAVAPSMQAERWGRVVNISSISALGGADRVNYVSAKAGLEGLTKAAALELAPDGITVNAIGPGVVRTAMTEVSAARAGRSVDEHLDVLKRTIPVGRVGTPHDIARAVAFFTDDDAGYITGQVLYVSGAPHG
jgi:3-oxoacyl-[acyl-carrier protein] reductase